MFVRPIAGAVRASVVATWASALATAALVLVAGDLLADALDGNRPGGSLWLLLGIAILRGALAAISPSVSARAAGRLESWIRDRIWRHVLRLGVAERSRERTGRIVSVATDGAESIAAYTATFIGPMIASATVPLLVLACVAIFVDALAALILLAAMPVIPLMVRGLQTRFASVSTRYRAANAELSARFLDAIQGLTTLKLSNRSREHGERLDAHAEGLRARTMRLLLANQIVLLVVDALFALAMTTASALIAMVRLRDGAIDPAQAVELVLLSTLLIEPLDRIGQFFYLGMSGRAASKEVREMLDAPPVVPEDSAAAMPDAGDGSVEMRDVRASYGDTSVLRGVSLRVEPGETLAIVGASGAGKSTIAALLRKHVAPDSGTVCVGGLDVSAVPAAWVRSQIAVVAQTTYLFSGTLRDNLLVASPGADDERLRSTLAAANLSLPLNLAVGERGARLSGGEAQRVSIARALLRDAPIVVLDEPTSNIDLHSEALVLDAIERLCTGRTVLLISHRETTIRRADRVVVLDDGVMRSPSKRSRR